jgi:hypothetical protein
MYCNQLGYVHTCVAWTRTCYGSTISVVWYVLWLIMLAPSWPVTFLITEGTFILVCRVDGHASRAILIESFTFFHMLTFCVARRQADPMHDGLDYHEQCQCVHIAF